MLIYPFSLIFLLSYFVALGTLRMKVCKFSSNRHLKLEKIVIIKPDHLAKVWPIFILVRPTPTFNLTVIMRKV